MNTKKHYEAQAPHTEKDCKINEKPHNHPDMDCGHTVNAGPGQGVQKYDGGGGVIDAGCAGPSANRDQDAGGGPGIH